jgi:hypothetical protein
MCSGLYEGGDDAARVHEPAQLVVQPQGRSPDRSAASEQSPYNPYLSPNGLRVYPHNSDRNEPATLVMACGVAASCPSSLGTPGHARRYCRTQDMEEARA